MKNFIYKIAYIYSKTINITINIIRYCSFSIIIIIIIIFKKKRFIKILLIST